MPVIKIAKLQSAGKRNFSYRAPITQKTHKAIYKPITARSSNFSGLKEEIETIVSLRVNKIIKKMNLVKKDEFDALKKMVQKVMMENEKLKKTSSRSVKSKKKTVKKKKTIKKKSKR